MADISVVSRLIQGIHRDVNLQDNTLVVGSLKVGSVSPTELTKTILDRLVSLQNGSDVDQTYHTHDGRYFTETELGSTAGTSGAERIGVKATAVNFTPASADVEAWLTGLDEALAATGSASFSDADFEITDDANATRKLKFDVGSISNSTTRTVTMPDSDVDLGDIATNTEAIADLVALSGVAANATDYGAFTGSIIPDNSTAKQALQALESEIESLPTPFYYAGTWNATTNTPTLDNSDTGVEGALYYVSVAGTVDFGDGAIEFAVGDKVVNNGTTWDKWDNTDQVTSVFGRQGAVTAQAGDYDADQITVAPAGNITATDAQAAFEELDTIKANTSDVDAAFTNEIFGQATVVSSGTPYQAADTTHYYLITGTSAQTFRLPDLGDLRDGEIYEIINRSTQTVTVQRHDGTAVTTVPSSYRGTFAANPGSPGWLSHSFPISSASNTLSANSGRIINVADASSANDAVNKGQLDAVSATVTTNAERTVRIANAGESLTSGLKAMRWAKAADSGFVAGRLYRADYDASSADNFHVAGLFVAAGTETAGTSITIVKAGKLTVTSHGFTVGQPLYLSASGAVTATPPSTANQAVVKVGMAEDANTIDVNIQVMGVN